MKIFLIGALTSKPYAFTARSWELKSVETIDLFDSLCSNIKIDIRGSEVLRVLPINNDFINEEWISDKTRFSYDALKRWRFTLPLLKKDGIYKEVSWKESAEFLENKLEKNKYDDIIFSTGNYIDLETISFLKDISLTNKKVTVNPFLTKSNLRSNFFLESSLLKEKSNLTTFLIVGTNLRLENPIINLRLRNLSKKQKVFIGFIGSKYDYNINCYHIGHNINNFYQYLKGKHSFCTLEKNFIKQDNRKKKFNPKTNIILGSEFLNTLSTSIYKYILNNKRFNTSTLYNYSGTINALELNAIKKNYNNISKESSKIFYNIGIDYVPNMSKDDLSIFQGHHNDLIRTEFDLILPSINWIEGSYTYLNCLNIVQKTNKVIAEFNSSRPNWKILKIMGNILRLSSNSLNINDIQLNTNKYSPVIWNNLNIYNTSSKFKLSLNYKKHDSILSKKLNLPCKPFITDYYSDSSLVRSSKVMNLCKAQLKIENKLLI